MSTAGRHLQAVDISFAAPAEAEAASQPSQTVQSSAMQRSCSDTTEQARSGRSFSPRKSITGFECAACSACQSLEAHLGAFRITSAVSLPADIEAELLPVRRAKLQGQPVSRELAKGPDSEMSALRDSLKPI